MQDYKQHAILYVDDEEMALKYFERSFGQEFRILTANSAAAGLKIIEERGEDIGVLLTDQRMPGEKGVQLLERARQLRPRMVRMMVTAYADFGVTVDAVNLGNIFRYVSKPIQVEDMRNTLRRASEFYMLQRERDDLVHEKLSVVQSLVVADRVISLGVLGAGLNQQFRHALEAVQAFLKQASTRGQFSPTDVSRLRDPAFWRDFYDRVLSQSQRCGQSIQALGVSDGPKSEVAVDPAVVLQSVLKENAAALAAKGIQLDSHVPAALASLQAEPGHLQRLFSLILGNQAATLSAPATIVIWATAGKVNDETQNVRITFTDNGAGIPGDAVRAVFDPFALNRNHDDAVGLNLLGVYLLVYHYGGSIEVTSQKEGGTSYVIELPLSRPVEPPQATANRDFITQVMMNDSLWERLIAG